MNEATVFTTGDIRLTRLFTRGTVNCATVNEYAQSSGIRVDRILDLLGEHLDSEILDIEAVGGEIFIHTAPHGRPGSSQLAQPMPNMWEQLRNRYDAEKAFAVWKLVRELEAGGWSVETDESKIPPNEYGDKTPIGIRIHAAVLPILVRVPVEKLAGGHGPLTGFELRGLGGVIVTCPNGKLDQYVTGIRSWMLTRFARSRMHVLVLEEPRYTPVLLGPDDSSVTPKSVSIEDLETGDLLK